MKRTDADENVGAVNKVDEKLSEIHFTMKMVSFDERGYGELRKISDNICFRIFIFSVA